MSKEKSEENKVINFDKYIDHLTGTDDDDDYIEKGYDFTRDSDPTDSSGIWQEEIKALTDLQTIESMFFSEDWVYIVVDLVSQKISSQPLAVMKKKVVDGTEVIEFADGHPLNELIEQPNQFQSYNSWMYNFVTQYTLMGNAINWYSDSLKSLVTLRTSKVTIDFKPDGTIRSYIVSEQNEDNPIDLRNTKVTSFDPKQIIHTARPNPASIIWGLSPFVPGRKSILFNRYSSDYLNSFYLKQATPGMVLEVDSTANEKTIIRQLRSFEMAYTGRRNQRRTMILPKGVKATSSSHSIADQRLIELLNTNRETILAILKVPKHEVGLQTAGSLGSEEYKTALRNFWEATIIPTMRMIEGSLNKFFKKQLGQGYFFKFDLADVEVLQDDLLAKADLGTKMLQAGMSLNEVRRRVWEMEEVIHPEADIPFVLRPPPSPFGQSFGSPKPDLPAEVTDEEDDTEQKSMTDEIETKELMTETLKLKAIIESRKKGFVDDITKATEDLLEGEQGQHIVDVALETLISMAEASVPVIKRNLVATKGSEIVSPKKLRKELEKALSNFEEDYTNEYVNTLKSVVDLGYDQNLEMVLDSQDRDKIDSLRQRTEGNRKALLEARGIDSFAYISKTHTDRIMDQIIAGTEKGESIGKIIKRIQDTFSDPKSMLSKAETIGRTETLTAASLGQAASLQHMSEVIPGTKKAWLNVGDSRVRDAHLDKSVGGVSGEIVDANAEFSNGLRWPRDLKSGDAGQVINCRCALIALLPGEDLEL